MTTPATARLASTALSLLSGEALVAPPFQAGHFARRGFCAAEVGTLQTYPANAQAVVKQAGFSVHDAADWIINGFSAEEADISSGAGGGPSEAQTLSTAYSAAGGAAMAWAVTGLSPTEAIERAMAFEPTAILGSSWVQVTHTRSR